MQFILKKVAKKFGSFKKSMYLCTRNSEITPCKFTARLIRRDGRVVDYSGLENRRAERHRGFESLSLRSEVKPTDFFSGFFVFLSVLHVS